LVYIDIYVDKSLNYPNVPKKALDVHWEEAMETSVSVSALNPTGEKLSGTGPKSRVRPAETSFSALPPIVRKQGSAAR